MAESIPEKTGNMDVSTPCETLEKGCTIMTWFSTWECAANQAGGICNHSCENGDKTNNSCDEFADQTGRCVLKWGMHRPQIRKPSSSNGR